MPGSLSTIASASQELLIRSGNVAYTSMHAQYLQAKYELQAQRYGQPSD